MSENVFFAKSKIFNNVGILYQNEYILYTYIIQMWQSSASQRKRCQNEICDAHAHNNLGHRSNAEKKLHFDLLLQLSKWRCTPTNLYCVTHYGVNLQKSLITVFVKVRASSVYYFCSVQNETFPRIFTHSELSERI